MSLYVKDTKDFTNKLERGESVPEDCLLITLDVKSLYPNIPNNQGIKAVRKTYTQRVHHVKSISIRRGYYVDTSKTKSRRIST